MTSKNDIHQYVTDLSLKACFCLLICIPTSYGQNFEYQRVGSIPLLSTCIGEELQVKLVPQTQGGIAPDQLFSLTLGSEVLNDSISLILSNDLLTYFPKSEDPPFFSVDIRDNSSEIVQKVWFSNQHCNDLNFSVLESKTTNLSQTLFYSEVSKEVRQNQKLNYNQTNLLDVYLTGLDLTLQDNPSNLLGKYNKMSRIRNIYINARNLSIQGNFEFPNSSLYIKSKFLKFLDKQDDISSISTKPKSEKRRPLQGTPGLNGIDAGIMDIRFEKLDFSSKSSKRFLVTGGDGQPAGFGKNGLDRNSADLSKPIYPHRTGEFWNLSGHKKELISEYPNLVYINSIGRPVRIPFGSRTVAIPTVVQFGNDNLPKSGGDAVAPGKPGEGGNGGRLIGPDILSSISDVSGGYAGDTARSVRGGWPQKPSTFSTLINRVWEKKTVKQGKSFRAPFPKSWQGKDGSKSLSNDYEKSWLTIDLLEMEYKYIDFLYYSGQYSAAVFYIEEFLKDIDEIIRAHYNERQLEIIKTYTLRFTSIKNQISNELDYYGNPLGWVPNLTFEVNANVYENEVETALSTLIHISRLRNVVDAGEESTLRLSALRQQAQYAIENLISNFNQAAFELPQIELKLDSVQLISEKIEGDLKLLEVEIQKRAEKNLEPPGWKKTVSTISTLMKVVPVSQPALAAISIGLDAAVKYEEGGIGGVVSEIPTFYKLYSQSEDYQKNMKSFVDVVKKTDWTSLESIKKNRDSMNKKTSLLSEYYKNITVGSQEQKVPASAIEAEIQRIKNSDPLYIEISKKLETLTSLKSQVLLSLQSINAVLDQLPAEIMERVDAINAFDDAISVKTVADIYALRSVYSQLELNALRRLRKYQYFMKKSYEYRFLEPYPVDMSLDNVVNEVRKLCNAPEQVDDEEILRATRSIYSEMIGSVNESIIDLFNDRGLRLSSAFERHLTQEEIQLLKNTGEIKFNLNDTINLFHDKENLRIIDIDIEAEIAATDLDDRSFTYCEFSVDHAGISLLSRGGRMFRFYHKNGFSDDLGWKKNFDLRTGRQHKSEPSARDFSLLMYLTKKSKNLTPEEFINYSLFNSYPGLITDLIFRMIKPNELNPSVHRITLIVEYEYEKKDANRSRLLVTSNIDPMKPQMRVNIADLNGNRNGSGNVDRIYNKNAVIKLEAENQVGGMEFSHFMVDDQKIDKQPYEFTMDGDRRISAIYERVKERQEK